MIAPSMAVGAAAAATLPLLYPTLLMVALFRFIETLKHFPLIFVMTNGGPGRATQTNFGGSERAPKKSPKTAVLQ